MAHHEDEQVEGHFETETEKAILITNEDFPEGKWIPRSVCNHISKDGKGNITLTVEHWFAEREGLA